MTMLPLPPTKFRTGIRRVKPQRVSLVRVFLAWILR
jgi:hypothetical protein